MKKDKGLIMFIGMVLILLNAFPKKVLAQISLQEYSQSHAIPFDNIKNLPHSIYEKLNNYDLIMIGEMHGTQEPPLFLVELAKLAVKNGDSLQIGFEIPEYAMKILGTKLNVENIRTTDWFKSGNPDGRSNEGWFTAITQLLQIPTIQIFFFDQNLDQKNMDYDSAMYHNIKKQFLQHPIKKMITISGNIHNRLQVYNDRKTMGLMLLQDSTLNINICSLSHFYESGEIITFNDLENKFEITATKTEAPPFSTLNLKNYFLLFPDASTIHYNGLIYTQKVHASKPLK